MNKLLATVTFVALSAGLFAADAWASTLRPAATELPVLEEGQKPAAFTTKTTKPVAKKKKTKKKRKKRRTRIYEPKWAGGY